MAVKKAIATGNWSATGTWDGGTLPLSGDDVYSNTFTVTIDQDITVKSLNNGTTTGVTAGGKFTMASPASRVVTVTDTLVNLGGINASGVLEITGSGGSCTINASLSGTSLNGRSGLYVNGSTATIVINGDVTGGSNAGSAGINTLTSGCDITINGIVMGGTSGPGFAGQGTSLKLTCNEVVKGGTINTSANGVLISGTATAAFRVNGIIDWTANDPISSSVPVQFGDDIVVMGYDDSNWPTASGGPINLTPGSGFTPSRYLNVGGVATPIG